MARNVAIVRAPVELVWSVLTDPEEYDNFVVGAKRIRSYDADWPAAGAALHHTLGVWPGLIRDSTSVVATEAPSSLRLHARMGPLGVNEVVFTLRPVNSSETEVSLEEKPLDGAAKRLWNPVAEKALAFRNRETLRRLSAIAEDRERARPRAGSTGAS